MKKFLEKIFVKHNPNEPMSIEQAGNKVHEMESRTDQEIKDWAKTVPGVASIAPMADRVKFLNYAVELLDEEKYPIHYNLLKVRIAMAALPAFEHAKAIESYKFVAKCMSGLLKRVITVQHVRLYEQEAIELVQDEIVRTRASKMPLVGNV